MQVLTLTGQQCKSSAILGVMSARLSHAVCMGHRAPPAYI